MPFIEQQYRNYIDWYIDDAIKSHVWEALLGLQKVLDDQIKIPAEQFDGALNYTICQLYRKTQLAIAETLSLMLLNKYYLETKKYRKIKDAYGTLTAIHDAFEYNLITISDNITLPDIYDSLNRLYYYVKDRYIEHEKLVKKLNGDLT